MASKLEKEDSFVVNSSALSAVLSHQTSLAACGGYTRVLNLLLSQISNPMSCIYVFVIAAFPFHHYSRKVSK